MTLALNEMQSRFGRLLYRWLPSVYREMDNTSRGPSGAMVLGDLARYLDAFGLLLDRVRGTLDQRLADAFPDNSSDGRVCQDWLIPYFARLFDVLLTSPDLAGQRDEVAHAIRWRQGKGTLPCAEQIVESVTRDEAELQEGWRRVAVTARVGVPLLPPSVYGLAGTLDERWPSQITRHPGLPGGTIDLRRVSCAVLTKVVSPAVKTSRLGGVPRRWMQDNLHGAPEAPGSFDDVSPRTVDLRTPSFDRGHAHPRRLLAYTPVPFGLFPRPTVRLTWDEAQASGFVAWVRDDSKGRLEVRNASDRPVVITDAQVQLPPADLRAPEGGDKETVVLNGLRFAGTITVTRGRLQASRLIVNTLEIKPNDCNPDVPPLLARDSLIGTLSVPDGVARLERCTVRRAATCEGVTARNSIFAASLTDQHGKAPSAGLLEYCGIPAGLPALAKTRREQEHPAEPLIIDESCSTAVPVFLVGSGDDPTRSIDADAGVLSPDSPSAILFGADDGGELGVYHDGRPAPVVISGAQSLQLAEPSTYVLRDLVFAGALTVADQAKGALWLDQVVVASAHIGSAAREEKGAPAPVIDVKSTLFGDLMVDHGLARLEYCTVLRAADFNAVQASDCIFAGTLACCGAGGAPCQQSCLRYSRVPPAILALRGPRLPSCTGDHAVFFESDFSRGLAGCPGVGVLHPSASPAVCSGAEDGGEMGAYHEQRTCLRREAARDKLSEHLSVGLEPVLIPDARLHRTPAVFCPETITRSKP